MFWLTRVCFLSGSHILQYAEQLMDGTLPPEGEFGRPNPTPNPIYSRENLIQYMEKCSESYIIRSDPRRFLTQIELFEVVSGSDNIALSIEVWLNHLNILYHIICAKKSSDNTWTLFSMTGLLPGRTQWKTLLGRCCTCQHPTTLCSGADCSTPLPPWLRRYASPSWPCSRRREWQRLPTLHACTPGNGARADDTTFEVLKQELKRSKWLSPATMKLVYESDYSSSPRSLLWVCHASMHSQGRKYTENAKKIVSGINWVLDVGMQYSHVMCFR